MVDLLSVPNLFNICTSACLADGCFSSGRRFHCKRTTHAYHQDMSRTCFINCQRVPLSCELVNCKEECCLTVTNMDPAITKDEEKHAMT
jgi:hypothetical protein